MQRISISEKLIISESCAESLKEIHNMNFKPGGRTPRRNSDDANDRLAYILQCFITDFTKETPWVN